MNGVPADQGSWIFVSHSNRDFEKVRHVRDSLERIEDALDRAARRGRVVIQRNTPRLLATPRFRGMV